MSFNRVLSHAYRGCGTSLTAVRRSPEFQTLLRQQHALFAQSTTCSCRRARAQRSGHFAVGRAINPYKDFSYTALNSSLNSSVGHPLANYEIEERAHLIHLGRCISQAAYRYSIPRKFHAWAREWREAKSADEQLAIASKVCERLTEKSRKHEIASMHSDMLNQPRARVLPYRYGRWNPHADVIPNCLGKAQLVQTFFEMCGAETISALPIFSAPDRIKGMLGVVCRSFYEALKDSKLQGSAFYDKLMKGIKEDYARAYYEAHKPSWPHMGIMVKLSSGRWAIVDPNFTGARRVPAAWDISRISRILKTFEEELPGLSITHSHDTFDKMMDFPILHYVSIKAKEFLERLHQRATPLRGARAFRQLQKSELVQLYCYLLTASSSKRRKKKKAATEDDTPNNPLYIGIMLALSPWMETKILEGVRMEDIFASGSMVDAINSGEAQRILQGKVLDECLEQVPANICYQGLLHFQRRWRQREAGDLMHPVAEFGCASYQLSLHTFSHVAVDLGLADELAAVMLRHGYGQYLLHNAASVVHRNPELVSATRPQLDEVVSHLTELPKKLRSTTFLLKEMKTDAAA